MDDGKLEMVIKGLEKLRDVCNAKSDMSISKGKIAWAGYANNVIDAIALLKNYRKQESIQPTLIRNNKDTNEYWLICSFCKHKIDALFRFCPNCGTHIEL